MLHGARRPLTDAHLAERDGVQLHGRRTDEAGAREARDELGVEEELAKVVRRPLDDGHVLGAPAIVVAAVSHRLPLTATRLEKSPKSPRRFGAPTHLRLVQLANVDDVAELHGHFNGVRAFLSSTYTILP